MDPARLDDRGNAHIHTRVVTRLVLVTGSGGVGDSDLPRGPDQDRQMGPWQRPLGRLMIRQPGVF